MATPIDAPPAASEGAGGAATTALVLGITGMIGFLCCQCLQVVSPVAWYLGHQELKAIREGRSSAAGESSAKTGMILGILGTALFVVMMLVIFLWIFLFGGLAVIGALVESTRH